MRRAAWALLRSALFLPALLAMGCESLFSSADRPAGSAITRALPSAIPADTLIVESVLLERPLGDAFIDRELWSATSPAGPPEVRSLLIENGIQAGILTGNLPTQFQKLLSTKAEVIDPHLMTFTIRKEAVVPTAGPLEVCKFGVLTDLAGSRKAISLQDANCGILVRPHPAGDGRVKLWCEPQIQHGSRQDRFRPNEDGTQFTRYEEVPTEAFPSLGFEVAMRADECLVIGCISEQEGGLGPILFEAEANGNLRQRIAVIRARQVNVSNPADLPAITLPGRRPVQSTSSSDK